MPITREWQTLNLRHMKLPAPRMRRRARKALDGKLPTSSWLPSDQRIRWWNIVPGDQVRVLGQESAGVREVLAIDKLTNMVYLRYHQQADISKDGLRRSTPVHYSKCQLLVGQYRLPTPENADTPSLVDVFAKRISTSPPKFLPPRYEWTRYATAIVPRLPEGVLPEGRIPIPWPEEPAPPEPISRPTSVYDTPESEASKRTWSPPTDLVHPGREKTKQWANLYLATLANPLRRGTLNFPMEMCITDELANPHSRRVKQKRWQAAVEARKRDQTRIRMATLRDRLPGTSMKDAIAEADWKFKQLVLGQKKETKKKRWVQSGGLVSLLAKRRRKARKARALVRRLNRLDIKPELALMSSPTAPSSEAQL